MALWQHKLGLRRLRLAHAMPTPSGRHGSAAPNRSARQPAGQAHPTPATRMAFTWYQLKRAVLSSWRTREVGTPLSLATLVFMISRPAPPAGVLSLSCICWRAPASCTACTVGRSAMTPVMCAPHACRPITHDAPPRATLVTRHSDRTRATQPPDSAQCCFRLGWPLATVQTWSCSGINS